jgi:hypothetical protein
MLEINSVLAGKFDAPDYAPQNNIVTNDVGEVDSRRYTKFDRSATEAGSVTDFSFSDFLDLVNPLQHIPVLSSIYREVMDEKINPVSRIAGDLIYGALAGGVTAVIGGAGAIANTIMEAETGKDGIGAVVSALFGSDEPVKFADATAPADTPTLSSAIATPSLTDKETPVASAAPVAERPTIDLNDPNALKNLADEQTKLFASGKAFVLPPNKMPFGGAMDPGQLQGTNMALALAAAAPAPHMGDRILTGKFSNNIKPSAIGTPNVAADNPLPPELMQDIASLRAINQYKSTASQTVPNKPVLDVVN